MKKMLLKATAFAVGVLGLNLNAGAQYCDSYFTNVSYEHLTNVTFAGINNSSGGNTGGPVDYTSQMAIVETGSSYNFSASIYVDGSEYVFVWFDWNQNDILNDPGETYTVAYNVNTPGPFTISIPVPPGATQGVTRMRVMLVYANSTPNPCLSTTYGEAEDYSVLVLAPGACYPVTDITVSNIGSTNADVDWTLLDPMQTNWVVEYGLNGFVAGSGTMIPTPSIPTTITGLDPETSYDVYVYGDCGGGDISAPIGPVSFTTLPLCPQPSPDPITGLSASGATLNWTAVGLESKWDVEWGTAGFLLGAGNQDYALGANSDVLSGLTGSTDYHWYVRAVCDVNMGDGVDTTSFFVGPMSFTTQQACANPGSLGVMNNTSFGTSLVWAAGGLETQWNIVWGEAGFSPGGPGSNPINGVSTLPVNLTGLTPNTSYQFYVQAVCGVTPDMQSMWVGPYTWTTPVYCVNPGGLTSTAYTTTSATLNWSAGGIEIEWNVEYGEAGFTPGTGIMSTESSTTMPLTGLTPGTTYCYYVQSACGTGPDSSSQWVGPHCFSTLIACPEPTNLGAINITNTAANLLWQAGGSETNWDIEWGLPGFTPGAGEEEGSVNGTTSNPYYATGLNPSNSYEFYVRANCGGTDGSSVWAGPYSINTLMINDIPCDAIELGVDGVIHTYSNVLATNNGEGAVVPYNSGNCYDNMSWCGNAAIDGPMWFKFKATASGSAFVSTRNDVTTGFNTHTEIAVYSVGLCENYGTFDLLTANSGSYIDTYYYPYSISDPGSEGFVCSGLTPGDTYYIMVDKFSVNIDPYGWYGAYLPPSEGSYGISIIDLPTAEAGTSVTAEACVDGGVFDLFTSITGNSSTSGTWYNPYVAPGNDIPSDIDLTGVPAGTYPFFYVIDNGACGYDEVETAVTIVEGPSAGGDNAATACNSGDIYLMQYLTGFPFSGGTWSDDDNTGKLVNGIFLSDMFAAGTYDFTYTVPGNGVCPPATATVTITLDDCVGLGIESNTIGMLSAYPNPVVDVLTIQNLNVESANLEVFDVQGKLVGSVQLNNVKGNYQLNMNDFERGVYVVRISNDEAVQEVRVVKQ